MTTDKPTKWGDAQQYDAEPHPNYEGPKEGVTPSAHLLWMTPDPLGAVAAMSSMYRGEVIRDISQVTDDMRKQSLEDVQKTHLKAPLEAIKMHFMIEGVDRAFTHQHVRQRTAVYAQESLRFAIPGTLTEATTLPPSLAGTTPPDDNEMPSSDDATRKRAMWDGVLKHIDAAYHMLVETGMPAEEARGLLPHATATRLNYITDLRNMSDHAGNRLCTQAQFHWRKVFAQMMQAIADYTPDFSFVPGYTMESVSGADLRAAWEEKNRWQFVAIAQSGLFRPVCYQIGYCPFQASFDRACSIRERVEKMGSGGIPSDQWMFPQVVPGQYHEDTEDKPYFEAEGVGAIHLGEWLLDPSAART